MFLLLIELFTIRTAIDIETGIYSGIARVVLTPTNVIGHNRNEESTDLRFK